MALTLIKAVELPEEISKTTSPTLHATVILTANISL